MGNSDEKFKLLVVVAPTLASFDAAATAATHVLPEAVLWCAEHSSPLLSALADDVVRRVWFGDWNIQRSATSTMWVRPSGVPVSPTDASTEQCRSTTWCFPGGVRVVATSCPGHTLLPARIRHALPVVAKDGRAATLVWAGMLRCGAAHSDSVPVIVGAAAASAAPLSAALPPPPRHEVTMRTLGFVSDIHSRLRTLVHHCTERGVAPFDLFHVAVQHKDLCILVNRARVPESNVQRVFVGDGHVATTLLLPRTLSSSPEL